MKFKFHPKVYENLIKCYFYIGNNSYDYFLKVLDILQLTEKFNFAIEKEKLMLEFSIGPEKDDLIEETFFDKTKLRSFYFDLLEKYLEALSEEDTLLLLADIFASSEFEKMQESSWNHYGELVRDWRNELIHYLSTSNISYDFEKKYFIRHGEKLKVPEIIYKSEVIKPNFTDIFYNQLALEINKCHKVGAYTAALILCRKLIENRVIDLLREKFPANEENIHLYYRPSDSRFHDFSVLMKNLEKKKESFGIDKKLAEELIDLIKPVLPNANSKAHSIISLGKEEEIINLQIEKIIGIILLIEKGIRTSGTN